MKKISCCKDCVPPKRHPGCHGSCEEYLKQKEERNRLLEQAEAERCKDRDLTQYAVDRNERVRKHRGK